MTGIILFFCDLLLGECDDVIYRKHNCLKHRNDKIFLILSARTFSFQVLSYTMNFTTS